jgi:hypothetical protein
VQLPGVPQADPTQAQVVGWPLHVFGTHAKKKTSPGMSVYAVTQTSSVLQANPTVHGTFVTFHTPLLHTAVPPQQSAGQVTPSCQHP